MARERVATVLLYGLVCTMLALSNCSSGGGGGGGGNPTGPITLSLSPCYPSHGSEWNDYV